MADTLLTLVTNACNEVGVPPPLTVIGNVDPRAMNFLALAKKEVKELGRSKWWSTLTRFATFNTVVSQTAYNTPADFGALVPATVYGQNNKDVRGALSPSQWSERLKFGAIYGVPGFRMIGNTINILPAPTVVETYGYEYKSKNRVFSAALAEKETFTADDDVPMLDSHLVGLGIVWRYRYSKGLEYAEDFRIYNEAIEQTFAQDQANGIVILGANSPTDAEIITEGYVPETNFGS